MRMRNKLSPALNVSTTISLQQLNSTDTHAFQHPHTADLYTIFSWKLLPQELSSRLPKSLSFFTFLFPS